MRLFHFLVSGVVGLAPRVDDYVFTKHKAANIRGIFDVLYRYSCDKTNACSPGIEQRRFSDLSRDLWRAQEYVKKREDQVLYLGWTPLCSDFRGDFEFIRNDNNFPGGSEISYKKIPLYFVIIDPKLSENKIFVEKIIHNPSIEVRLDVNYLKLHLEDIASNSDATLDLSKLKYHDSGRWYFEFLNTVVTPT